MVDGRGIVRKQHEERGKHCRDVQLDVGLSRDKMLSGHGESHGNLLVIRYIRHDKFNRNYICLRDGAGNEGQKLRGDSDRVVRDAN